MFGVILVIVLIVTGCFYLVFSHNENLAITYIKFKVNPEFIIGINSSDSVVFYNPLNDEAKLFDLSMVDGKSLRDVSSLFVEKLDASDYLVDKSIDIVVMTKNKEKEKRIYELINESVKVYNDEISVECLEPTIDELIAYSNETVYDLIPSYKEEDLMIISREIYTKVTSYVDKKLKALKLDGVNDIEIIKENYMNGYFNDFSLSSVIFKDYLFTYSKRSTYHINFNYHLDNTYDYEIILDLELDCSMDVETIDYKEGIVEVYKFLYQEVDGVGKLEEYKNCFYKFRY